MSSTIVIHVLRPYANEEDYLASERFSIDSKSMLLIDQPPLPVDTAIVFDVQLENGQKPIRAEARVIGYVAPTGDQSGGLRVRFKRFGAATKSFIDRAIGGPSSLPAPSLPARSLSPASLPSESKVSVAEQAVAESNSGPASARRVPSLVPAPPSELAQPALDALATPLSAADRSESSGIHRRPVVPVAAPINREELLERLRTRTRSGTRPNGARPDEQTG